MTRLRTSASKVRLDLEATVRTISREVGLGVVEALQQRSAPEVPYWRAEQLALGFIHGVDEGMDDEHRRRMQALSDDIARAFARGALDELRDQLGPGGEGPLTQALGASAARVAGTAVRSAATPLALIGLAVGVGVFGALLLRRA